MDSIFATAEKAGPQMTQTPQSTVYLRSPSRTARTPSFEEIKDRVATEIQNSAPLMSCGRKAQELADRAHASMTWAAAKESGANRQDQ